MTKVSLKVKRTLSQRPFADFVFYPLLWLILSNKHEVSLNIVQIRYRPAGCGHWSGKGTLCWEPLARILVTISQNGRQSY